MANATSFEEFKKSSVIDLNNIESNRSTSTNPSNTVENVVVRKIYYINN